jgi:dihydropteroate synthase
MQQNTDYADIVDDLTHYFSERIDQLYTLGIKDLWIDPGFGFAKTTVQNHELLMRLDELTTIFREPLLVGMSRKSMIYKPLNITADQALAGTIALDTLALERGARILRVHDPRPAQETIKLMFQDI